MCYPFPEFLPGQLWIARGSAADYFELEDFHYLPKRPATWAQVWTIHYRDAGGARVAAVGVLSFPVPSCRGRERYFGNAALPRGDRLRFANANLRTISRVIVHPQFRSLGLSSTLVRCLCDHCDTRYVEATAMMGRAHPFFEKAGMMRIEPLSDDEPAYFILDRAATMGQTAAAPATNRRTLCEPLHAGQRSAASVLRSLPFGMSDR